MGKRANGEGTISKRRKDGKTIGWKGSVTVGLTSDGRPDRRWISGRTQDEVREKIRALQSQVHTGMLANTGGLTVGDYLTSWVDGKALEGVKPNTVRSYRDTARLCIVPHLGTLPLDKLRPTHVQHLLKSLMDAGKSAQRCQYTLRVLGMALRHAVRLQLLPRNVAEVVKAPRVEHVEMQVWTPGQADTFLKAARPHRLYAAFYLALMTGMRRGEVLGLQWKDIDWDRSRLTVRHSLVEVRREPEGRILRGRPTVSRLEVSLQTPKTRGSRRTILLSPGTIAALREHRRQQDAERAVAGEAWPGSPGHGHVFATELGTPTDPRNFYRHFIDLIQGSGVPRLRLHDLRHTAASLMIRQNIPPKTVSERLGHADVAFTLRVYTHLYDEQREEAAFDLADLLPDAP